MINIENSKFNVDSLKENKEIVIAAINKYLDKIYNVIENGEKETEDTKVLNFLNELKMDAGDYEKLRRKILDNNFDLSNNEIFEIINTIYFSKTLLEKERDAIDKTIAELDKINGAAIGDFAYNSYLEIMKSMSKNVD